VKVPLALAGMNLGRPVAGPRTIHIDVTNTCNTNCITCWDHSPLLTLGRKKAWKRRRLDAEAVEELLSDASELGGLREIVLSGQGEPFTHPEIYGFIQAVKRRGLHLTIITNLVAADVERVLQLDVDQLLVGIHGASEASYLAFHPSFRPAEWARLHVMLERFAREGRRYKHVQVICQPNAHELAGMVEQGARYKAAQVTFKLASLRKGTEAARITPAQRAHLRSELVPRAMERAAQLGVSTNLSVFASQLDSAPEITTPMSQVGCFMGYAYARVLVDGTVLYCCSTEINVGSLQDAPFRDLWTGPRWQEVRDRLRRGDYFPSCEQCGKLNQNVKLGAQFRAHFGQERLDAVLGRT
jgi:wyosine [tRNA(Phe)-imidazoG37] synthetase (radical SAM superfamily)